MSRPPLIFQIVLIAVVAMAAIYDIRFRRIPNWLVLAGLVIGIGLNTFLFEWAGLLFALKGFAFAFVIYFPLYLLRGMGAGDVKLMAAIGSIVGWRNWLGIFIITAVVGSAGSGSERAYPTSDISSWNFCPSGPRTPGTRSWM